MPKKEDEKPFKIRKDGLAYGIGVGSVVLNPTKHPGCVLIGKRKGKGTAGAGLYAFPGGHIDYGESVSMCAQRETFEECNLDIKKWRYWTMNNVFEDEINYHYFTIFMIGETDQEPENKEPDKNEEWIWAPWDDDSLFSPSFPPLRELREPLEGPRFSPFVEITGEPGFAPPFIEGQKTGEAK